MIFVGPAIARSWALTTGATREQENKLAIQIDEVIDAARSDATSIEKDRCCSIIQDMLNKIEGR